MYGILRSSTNTGDDDELVSKFVAPLSINSNQPSFVADTLSLKRRTGNQFAQRWELTTKLETIAGTPDILTHLISSGFNEEIFVRFPQIHGLNLLPSNLNIKLTDSVVAPQSTINVSGLLGEQMRPGEFFNIAGDLKVYLVTEAGTDGTNVGVQPPIRKDIAAGAALSLGDKVTMVGKYDNNTTLGITYSDGVLGDAGTVNIVEALE
jgi:hypothetical protein